MGRVFTAKKWLLERKLKRIKTEYKQEKELQAIRSKISDYSLDMGKEPVSNQIVSSVEFLVKHLALTYKQIDNMFKEIDEGKRKW